MMTQTEKQAAFGIASIYAVRMLGLFVILPVFAIDAINYGGATPLLIGLALGCYGLTQAIFQIPFGALSDKIGRKKIITFGLLLFILGSLVAANAESIWQIILGRSLQGSGAIAGALLALSADLTSDKNRTKIMAGIGASIGVAFTLSIIIGPLLYKHLGLNGIFYLIAVFGFIGIILLHTLVPNPRAVTKNQTSFTEQAKHVIKNPALMTLVFGIFALHLMLMAFFVVVPIQLFHFLPNTEMHSLYYLIVCFVAFLLMIPMIIWGEKKVGSARLMMFAIIGLGLGALGLSFSLQNLYAFVALLIVFFTSFNLLEATLPSAISRKADPNLKGTTMGIYSTAQFLGTFLGGVIGGFLLEYVSMQSIFIFCMFLSLLWVLITFKMSGNKLI